MKKSTLSTQIVFIFFIFAIVLSPLFASGQTKKFSKGSMFMSGQIESQSYIATPDPFDSMPFPFGISYEYLMTDHIGIGATFVYDKWCDYLGMFGGKYSFRIFKPSLDLTYHFDTEKLKGMNFFSGVNLGYSLLSVRNELGNEYPGNLRSEPHLAPFLGTHLYFWENLSGFFSRIMITLKAYWSVTGNYSGLSGIFGITYKIK